MYPFQDYKDQYKIEKNKNDFLIIDGAIRDDIFQQDVISNELFLSALKLCPYRNKVGPAISR